MVPLVFRPLPKYKDPFARRYRNEPSPEILLNLPFSGIFRWFFRVWLLLKPLSRSRSVAGVHVCVRVCGCECVCCAVLCVWKNTENPKEKPEKCVWYVCVVWCCEVRKYTKNTRNIGTIHKTWSPFLARYGHPWTRKRSKIGHFSQRILFTLPLGFADDFRPRS